MNRLIEGVYATMPKINQAMAKGFATIEVPKAMGYLDSVIKSSSKISKLEYIGYRRLTPQEEYEVKKSRNNEKNDISTSDVVLYELFFNYDGVKVPKRLLYLPFVKQAGIMRISGVKYAITPVLTDTIISPSKNEVFVRLLKIKQFYRSITRNIVKNSSLEYATIVYSKGLGGLEPSAHKSGGFGNSVIAPAVLYILAKYGITETFKRYCGCSVIMTNDKLEVNTDVYDIYESTGYAPNGVSKIDYTRNKLKIYIEKSVNKTLSELFIGGIIYAFDILPSAADNLLSVLNADNRSYLHDETSEWVILAGRLAYRDHYTVGRAYALVVAKLSAMETYMDPTIMTKLKEIGLGNINTYYDLISHMIEGYAGYLMEGRGYASGPYNRYVDILYYLMYNFIVAINKTVQDISNMEKTKILDANSVATIMNSKMSSKTIFGIKSGGKTNICLSPIDSTSDSMYNRITGKTELQERGNGVMRDSKKTNPASTRNIIGVDLYIGTIFNLSKTSPTPKLNRNPFAMYDLETGRIAPTKKQIKTLKIISEMLSGRTSDKHAIKATENETVVSIEE